MSDWNLFPLDSPRPSGIKKYAEQERAELEILIASQVSDVLGFYGILDYSEVDNRADASTDDVHTIHTLEVNPIQLDDDGLLLIGQLPPQGRGFCYDAGAHSVTKVDEYGRPQFMATVWDPQIDTSRRITSEHGNVFEIPVLQELFESLHLISGNLALNNTVNTVPFDTAQFPFTQVEPILEHLEQQFRD